MSEYKYRADDIKEVVQLVDLDAVYIDPTGIEERENISRVYYAKDRMYVKDYTQILRRNTQKNAQSRPFNGEQLFKTGQYPDSLFDLIHVD